MSDRLYRALGLTRGATADEIKKAYRKLALDNHPDRNPGDEAAEKRFKEANEAHTVLSDPEKRKLYDQFGEASLQAGFDAARARAFQNGFGGRGGGASQFSNMFGQGFGGFGGFGGVDLEDLLGGGGRRQARQPARGRNIEARITVDFMDAARGASKEIAVSRPKVCDHCKGRGDVPDPRSKSGRRMLCPRCRGTGTLKGEARLKVTIPAGLRDGQTLRLGGQGEPAARGRPAGDLLITVGVEAHPLLRREGLDLHLDLPVTLGEAMLGGKVTVPTLKGSVTITLPAGSQNGRTLRLRGKGIVTKGNKGDLLVHLTVKLPSLDDEQREALRAGIEQLEERYEESVRDGLKL